MKLTILSAIILLAAEVLAFTATIIIGFLTGGTNNTVQVIGSIAASIIIGSLMAFVIGNNILKPLSELVKATRRVTSGDFNVKLEIGWSVRHTIKELQELIRDFNDMTE